MIVEPNATPENSDDLPDDKSLSARSDLPSKQRHDVTIGREISDIEIPSTLAYKATSLRGSFIGPYKLLQEIGQGGMGTVWMAEQEKPLRRRVALKLIKKGQDSEQFVARFEAERQALAMMDHQNIAKVLDAGTTSDGRPFFVMELVSGIPLTKYCDNNRLSVKDRLELFIPVCSAVQHAHQKGIIHRDLKPSNVLVTLYDGKPVPKVIDFGLAKALQSQSKLTDKTLFTEIGQVVGTLQYMSPEQAEMNALDIDTRTDVYSLGVMLYELLTGSTPIDKETMANQAVFKVLELIREKEPPRPSVRLSSVSQKAASGISDQRRIEASKLKSILRGELDWIVMKALEKDRTRRYGTASGLSEELARYLAGDPVQARPPTTGYRIQKYVLKHKGLVASLTTIVGLLLLGIIGTTWFGFIASEQRVRADKKAIEANSEKELKTIAAAEAIRQRGIAEKKSAEAIESEKKANEEKRKTQLALDESEAMLARSNYFLANARWNENRALEANELLQSIHEKYRKFEWYLDRRLYEGSDATLYGHQGLVLSVKFSPDGQRIASGSIDNTIKLWDAQTGEELQTFYAHEGAVLDVAFSPDGTSLASCDGKWAINLRDSQSGAVLHTFIENGKYVEGMAFSCDGKLLAARVEKDVILWDVQTGVRVRTLSGHREDVRSLAFSADGKLLATGSFDNTIKLWNLETGYELRTLSEHVMEVASIAFSPEGNRLLSGSQDSTLKLWDTQSGKCLKTFRGHKRDVTTVAFSPDGQRVASGSRDNTIKLWDANRNRIVVVLRPPAGSDMRQLQS